MGIGRLLACGAGVVLLAVSACAWAAIEGGTRHAWTGSVNGPALHGRGQRAVSAPIRPVGVLPQAEGVITTVRWRYRFVRTPPVELQAYLCNAQRCVMLPQAEGQTSAFAGDDATEGFVFAFRVPGRGSLVPVLQGGSNEVVIGFR